VQRRLCNGFVLYGSAVAPLVWVVLGQGLCCSKVLIAYGCKAGGLCCFQCVPPLVVSSGIGDLCIGCQANCVVGRVVGLGSRPFCVARVCCVKDQSHITLYYYGRLAVLPVCASAGGGQRH
jgi:hypothetical protein